MAGGPGEIKTGKLRVIGALEAMTRAPGLEELRAGSQPSGASNFTVANGFRELGLPPVNSGISLISRSSDVPERIYGTKAYGLGVLSELQGASPVPYLVPLSFALRMMREGGFVAGALAYAFDALTHGLAHDAVLMARSSGYQERPGANSTLFSRFDPQNIDESRRRFESATHTVASASEDMGVVLTRLVGRKTATHGLKPAIGRENASFVANSHSLISPDELFIAIAHGLGTRVVEGAKGSIIVTANREGGLVTGFVNHPDGVVRTTGFSGIAVSASDNYRQTMRDIYLLEAGMLSEERFDEQSSAPMEYLSIVDGKVGDLTIAYDDKSSDPFFSKVIGWSPFPTSEAVQGLFGVIKFLSDRLGPIQIEGAFAPDESGTVSLYLYQLLGLPRVNAEVWPLTITDPVLTSNRVMGRGKWTMPLVGIDSWVLVDCNEIKEIEARFADSGYALLADEHSGQLLDDTPHAKIRLSVETDNFASHIATDMLIQLSRDPTRGMMAMGVRLVPGKQKPPPDEGSGKINIWNNVTIESSGRELAIDFLSQNK